MPAWSGSSSTSEGAFSPQSPQSSNSSNSTHTKGKTTRNLKRSSTQSVYELAKEEMIISLAQACVVALGSYALNDEDMSWLTGACQMNMPNLPPATTATTTTTMTTTTATATTTTDTKSTTTAPSSATTSSATPSAASMIKAAVTLWSSSQTSASSGGGGSNNSMLSATLMHFAKLLTEGTMSPASVPWNAITRCASPGMCHAPIIGTKFLDQHCQRKPPPGKTPIESKLKFEVLLVQKLSLGNHYLTWGDVGYKEFDNIGSSSLSQEKLVRLVQLMISEYGQHCARLFKQAIPRLHHPPGNTLDTTTSTSTNHGNSSSSPPYTAKTSKEFKYICYPESKWLPKFKQLYKQAIKSDMSRFENKFWSCGDCPLARSEALARLWQYLMRRDERFVEQLVYYSMYTEARKAKQKVKKGSTPPSK